MQILELNQLLKDTKDQVIQWRRHLHQNPELSFQEYETSEFIYTTLKSFGALEVTRPTRTSVMARLIGELPGKIIAYRADIDALPILEENGFEFSSMNPGVMHACGHDGHTAILLGVAKILSAYQKKLKGEIRFIFQHAEEQPPGGAVDLVRAGVLDDVDFIVGAHLWTPLETGKISVLAGPTMAGGDLFNITVKGVGGHAGMPHEAVDPIPVAAQIITSLQQIVSRQTDPLDQLVLSITQMKAGTAHNAVPDTAELCGTVRYFDMKYRKSIPMLMERIVKGVTEAHGATYSFDYIEGYLPVINDREISEQFISTIKEHMKDIIVEDMRPPMVGEDFSSYLLKTRGCFVFIGAGNLEKGNHYPHHHPKFTVNEEALYHALRLFVYFASVSFE